MDPPEERRRKVDPDLFEDLVRASEEAEKHALDTSPCRFRCT